jgi:large subunit ribosomal protein L29
MGKAKDYRDQQIEELEATALDLSKEIFELRNSARQDASSTNPNRIREAKRDIARIKTIIGEKQRLQEAV